MSETTAPVGTTTPTSSLGSPATGRARGLRIALRTVQVLLALFYGVASALPKLIAHPSAVEAFDKIGWGSGAMYTIGALELAGAVALLIPVLQSVAALALGALMVGAFIVQLTAFDGQNAATPLILVVPLLLIAWVRRQHNTDLLGLLGRR
ncbi:DoxX family protein [Streptomyces dangxiongensis]|uniref:DoxX family protein n=1 Tax=Streptomyces dangxiongensis TaxID=1442032 RepID=A0A3G2JHJ3_9ACTN|nr:DoxX family protein [Streptomyces dangxiongensis]AYN41880.1 DoxX family protein [Streptomyces dangxiongensis]